MVDLGEPVLLVDEQNGDTFLARLSERTRIQTGHGYVEAEKIKARNFGEIVQSSTRGNFFLMKPSIPDFFDKLKRGPQIITLKDLGAIAAHCGLSPGQRIVEGGGGTGAASTFYASLVGKEGKLFTYEIREDFLELVKINLERAGLSERVELKKADIYEGISEEGVDAVLLDVPEPWRVLSHAHSALKPGGYLACYIPTTGQMERLVTAEGNPFLNFRCFASIEYDWQVKPGATRPKNMGLVHTGFICLARKI
jgi:tRNA (adenine57-N1/adenine58-N1)-methyltransferase catalytic subunit